MRRTLFLRPSILPVMLLTGILFSTTVCAQGSAKWKKKGKTIYVESGVFDGDGKEFGKVGSGSQDENQPAVFELAYGTSLKNVKIVPPAGDGIHLQGNNRISGVTFTDVGEDAISMRSSAKGGIVIIENSSFSKGSDKIFQANRTAVWYIKNCKVNGAGKVMRQNGGKTFKLTIFIDGLEAKSFGEAIVRSDASACTVYYKNCPSKWKGKLKTVKWDGKNPAPPKLPGSKPDATSLSLGDLNNGSNVNFTNALLFPQYDQIQFYDIAGRRASIAQSNKSTPSKIYLIKLKDDHRSRAIVDLQQ